jgi:hypothetical protein
MASLENRQLRVIGELNRSDATGMALGKARRSRGLIAAITSVTPDSRVSG